MPHPGGNKAAIRLQMQVIAGRMRILCPGVGELDANMGFERALVGGEANVAIDAK